MGPRDQPPYQEKSLEAVRGFEPWMIFGVHADGRVDVTDPNGDDILTALPRHKAEAIIEARRTFFYAALAILNGE